MKYCKYCMAENLNSSKICISCGAKLKGNNKTPVIIAIIVLILLLLGGGIFFLVKNTGSDSGSGTAKTSGSTKVSKKAINLNDYIAYDTDGYDGYGTVSGYIDWSKLKRECKDKLSFTDEGLSELAGGDADAVAIDYLKDYVTLYIDEMTGVSNGDDIDFHWDVKDSKISRYFKGEVVYEDGSHVVVELKECEKIDAFDGVTVTFSGVSPLATAELNVPAELRDYSFEFDQTQLGHLANGDRFVVKINENSIEYMLQKTGKMPAEKEKVFTVSGLDYYATSLNDINLATQKAIDEEADHYFTQAKAQLEMDESGKTSASVIKGGTRYLVANKKTGSFLVWRKDMITGKVNNEYYVVYETVVHHTISNSNGTYDDDSSYYWFMKYENIIINDDGEVKIDVTGYTTGKEKCNIKLPISFFFGDIISFSTDSLTYNGYLDPADIYNNYALTKDIEWSYEADYIH